MAYSRFRSGLRARGFKKVAVGPKPKRVYRKRTFVPKVSFAKRVNAIVSKNVENKCSSVYNYEAPIADTGGSYTSWNWFLVNNFMNIPSFQVAQGTGQNQRVGNSIKLKKWIIKGVISPYNSSYQVTEALSLERSFQGYVTIYFGRRTDSNEITADLGALFQAGNSSRAPMGRREDIMTAINKDVYKVYYKRRFKVGAASGQNSSTNVMPNNDFDLCKTFGFDVCKHIMKNGTIRFNDTSVYANHQVLRDLSFWAIFTPAIGELGHSIVNPTSYYRLAFQTYFEYEDA